MLNELTTIRELLKELKCSMDRGEPLIELESRAKGSWRMDAKNVGATA